LSNFKSIKISNNLRETEGISQIQGKPTNSPLEGKYLVERLMGVTLMNEPDKYMGGV
jgi:hypothetical protein